jgi:serine/threonine-protein kinase
VAVKMFRLHVTPAQLEQFVAEIDKLIAADLTHPGIAAPLGAGVVGSSAYLAQDFVAADSLDLSLRSYGPVPFGDAVRIAAQVAGALDFAAAVQVVHGALHPRDILVSADDTRLTGLGIVQALDVVGESSPLRPAYTAPERAAGDNWDRRADIFSLAAVVHELLWGEHIGTSAGETVEAITPIPGADRAALRAVFARALAEDPADRYETAKAFADALEGCFAIAQPEPALPPLFGAVEKPSSRLLIDVVESDPDPDDTEPALMLPRELPFLESPTGISSESGDRGGHYASSAEVPDGFRLSLDDPEQLAAAAALRHDHDLAVHEVPYGMADDAAAGGSGKAADGVSGDAVHDVADLDLRGIEDFAAEERDVPVAPAPRANRRRRSGKSEPEPTIAPTPVVEASASTDEETVPAAPAPSPSPSPSPSGHSYGPSSAARFSEYAVERSRSAVWPLALALIVGLAVGSAATFLLLNRGAGSAEEVADGAVNTQSVERAAAANGAPADPASPGTAAPSTREFTEAALPPEAGRTGRPDPGAANFAPAPRAEGARSEPPPSRARPQAAATESPRLLVRSTPAGARVLVDGRNVGVTPLTLRDLEPGSHAVRIVRDGYVAVERRVALTRTRASQSIAVNLSRAPAGQAAAAPVPSTPGSAGRTAGALVVDSRPTAANVFVDGKLVGTTPLLVDSVDPGTHVVRMERDGYGPWSTSVRVAPGERLRVSASLER